MFTKLFIKLIGVYLSLIDKLHILKEHIFVDFHIHTYIYECMSLCIYIHTQAYIERCTLFIYIHIYMNEIITIIKKTNISITPKVLCPWVFPNLHNKRPKLEDGCSWTRRTLLGFYPIACSPIPEMRMDGPSLTLLTVMGLQACFPLNYNHYIYFLDCLKSQ